MKLKWVKNEWACQGVDNWRIFGNKTGCGYMDKFAHLTGHFIAVLLFRYYFNIPILWLMIGSVSFGTLYEILWDNFAVKNGISKYDLIANTIGMLGGILCILIKNLVDIFPLIYTLFPYIIIVGFILTFVYKTIKLKRG